MTTVIRADRLLIDSSSELILQGAVVVQDKLIIHAGPWSEVKEKLTGNEKIKDLGDSTLMPGLFDCHVPLLSPSQTIPLKQYIIYLHISNLTYTVESVLLPQGNT
jgi:imidazolonepropionase-like amidohydrolase